MRTLKLIFYFLILLVGTYFVLSFYVDYQLAKKDYSDSYNDCRKVWSARGLYENFHQQNSIESIGRAFEEGAMGVEVDVRYDIQMQDFIVSHDYPYNKKNGKTLKLSELFEALGDDRYFWLDFKRLRHLSEQQTQDAIQRLYDISQKNSLYERIYVEGEAPIKLSRYREAGLHTIFDTHPVPESKVYLSELIINLYKMVFYFGNHSVMGLEYGELNDPVFGPETQELLKNVPVFLYHLPVDEALIDDMLAVKNVRAFIVGDSVSVNYFNKNSCDVNS